MPSVTLAGEAVPEDGSLPPAALAEVAHTPLSIYLHVPFCSTRCGYCDFNTYTSDELGPGASRADYLDSALAELDLAARALGGTSAPPVSTIFIGGGTPTLLPPADLARFVAGVADRFGLEPDAEITTEANPETVGPAELAALRAGGLNRISFGMQSARTHVLQVLDRVHTPGGALRAVRDARAAGFDNISLDLIYGTPGESAADWQASLDAALSVEPDHLSAYSLIVEEGTRLAGRIRRGELPEPDEDDLADKYLQAEDTLSAAGYGWYEVSNWARTPQHRARHNLAYWRGHHWWGIGPGAHSHIGGVRFWNVKHPAAYAGRLAAGRPPAYAREVLDADTRRIERILLELRLVDGLDPALLTDSERARMSRPIETGLATLTTGPTGDRLVLTRTGRLLADGVIRDLLD
ncbi:radical SAM family heme chaperone HemW [Granulicoccus phenolivorans]|uniref:radical SAM family heme chaperone HemW n=1 Tax=Granulicoccus phenolivorans TaxID=266854 RepID=UPI0003F920D4|nr:radical SAM family heme chaperone HemW [Granulicoccus phenolivorans]